MRKVAHNKNNDDVKSKLVIPSVRGTSERIQSIAMIYELHIDFHSHNTLGKRRCNSTHNYLNWSVEMLYTSSCVNVDYSISAKPQGP